VRCFLALPFLCLAVQCGCGCSKLESTWSANYPYLAYHPPIYEIRLYGNGSFSGETWHANGGGEKGRDPIAGRIYGRYEMDSSRISLTGTQTDERTGDSRPLDLEFVYKDAAYREPGSGLVLTRIDSD
jgi:hypothetical protein